jgi:hypothetical protein
VRRLAQIAALGLANIGLTVTRPRPRARSIGRTPRRSARKPFQSASQNKETGGGRDRPVLD